MNGQKQIGGMNLSRQQRIDTKLKELIWMIFLKSRQEQKDRFLALQVVSMILLEVSRFYAHNLLKVQEIKLLTMGIWSKLLDIHPFLKPFTMICQAK